MQIFLSMARNTISTAVLDESPSEESSGTQKATRHKSVVRRISSMMTPANSNISYISAAGPGALSDVGCRNDSGLPLSSNHIPESSSFTEGGPATLSSYKFQNQQTDPLEQEECTAVLQKQRQSTPPVRSVRFLWGTGSQFSLPNAAVLCKRNDRGIRCVFTIYNVLLIQVHGVQVLVLYTKNVQVMKSTITPHENTVFNKSPVGATHPSYFAER